MTLSEQDKASIRKYVTIAIVGGVVYWFVNYMLVKYVEPQFNDVFPPGPHDHERDITA